MLQLFNKAATELRASKRLLYGLVIIAMVVVTEGGLRWRDNISEQQATLTRLQTDVLKLKSHPSDEATLRTALIHAQRIAESMDTRLWTVSSEAVGQARLKDWLTGIVKQALANQYNVTLAVSRELAKPDQDRLRAIPAIREFRATVSFQLTPQALERVLLEIEGGEPFSAVETLVVKKQERRVDITVRVLMRIKVDTHV